MFPTPDHLIRAYYESLGKLASPAALTITGMPQTESSADYLHTRHGDLVWAMRGLTEQHMLVLGMRFAAASGVREYRRYVRNLNEAHSDESATGRKHPDDDGLHEVLGTYSIGATIAETAQRMGISERTVKFLLAGARGIIQRQAKQMGMMEA